MVTSTQLVREHFSSFLGEILAIRQVVSLLHLSEAGVGLVQISELSKWKIITHRTASTPAKNVDVH